MFLYEFYLAKLLKIYILLEPIFLDLLLLKCCKECSAIPSTSTYYKGMIHAEMAIKSRTILGFTWLFGIAGIFVDAISYDYTAITDVSNLYLFCLLFFLSQTIST